MIHYLLSLIYVMTHNYVTGWATDQSWLCSKYEHEIHLFLKVHRSAIGSTPFLLNRNWWLFCWSVACNWPLTAT